MKKYFILTSAFLTHFFTASSFALAQGAVGQATGAITTIGSIVTTFTETLGAALGNLAMAAGVIAFFYGVVQYIWGVREAKPEVIRTGNQFMVWGLVALFVMFSVYGIIKFGQKIFFNDIDVRTIEIPEIKFKSGSSQVSPSPASQPSPASPLGVSVLCPDGTYALRSSDCPKYSCPDGTVYYNPSDRRIICGSSVAAPTSAPVYTSPVSNRPASTQSEGNAGECIFNGSCRTTADYPGVYDSNCICQIVTD
jgi:hypothetical protein